MMILELTGEWKGCTKKVFWDDEKYGEWERECVCKKERDQVRERTERTGESGEVLHRGSSVRRLPN